MVSLPSMSVPLMSYMERLMGPIMRFLPLLRSQSVAAPIRASVTCWSSMLSKKPKKPVWLS